MSTYHELLMAGDPETVAHSKKFWDEKVAIKDEPFVVRADHTHYIVREEPGDGIHRGFLGHGGAEFKFIMFDGREIVSHNVWYQGEIPEEYWDRLPDNAERL
jgi:hypothetical protein